MLCCENMLTDIITKTCQDVCGGLEADTVTSEPPGKPIYICSYQIHLKKKNHIIFSIAAENILPQTKYYS